MTELAASSCRLHPDRPAAALCPGCRRYYCRECVTEHDDQLLCRSCMDAVRSPADRRAGLWEWPARLAMLGAGLFGVYTLFYFAGQILSWIPPDYHAGKLPWLP
ncbi:MAG: hypothetical protein A3G34_12080 [Candidatus Lindowbacteria bacterium RIFCSPLOWO2_12_FULL_62_27]|nr:MAG: hypothetical protein A3G34_12080 [Candidatus Lindowbacteria bacterium RIFCSPLOWO2_12_FULL_62_27]OGH61075.1 MAG: hypothetical protein A3I06_16230 [Candidatus Lindowbacteria bacterium RIFCSPLOWO2_02_FULL_62_12]